MSLRLIPGLDVVRPSNSEEIIYSYQYIFSKTNNPKALVLTRQNIDYLETNASYEDFKKGYYELASGTDATIFASGSEVNLAMEVSELLKDYVGPVTKSFSIDSFGASAPIDQLENNFNMEAIKISQQILDLL